MKFDRQEMINSIEDPQLREREQRWYDLDQIPYHPDQLGFRIVALYKIFQETGANLPSLEEILKDPRLSQGIKT